MPSQFTVPNILTAARIVMAFAAIRIAAAGRAETAVSVLIVAALLDAFDGWYARRFAQRTALGAHLDPVADKILMGVVYAWIGIETGSAIAWTLVGLVALREIGVTVLRSHSLRRRRRFIPASPLGRFKMLAQSMVGLTLLSVMHFLDRAVPEPVVVGALVVILGVSWVSAVGYVRGWRRAGERARAGNVVTIEREVGAARRVSAGR